MAETLQVELVTPEKQLFSDQAELVEAPGVEGDFGVLSHHAPFVSLLRPGTVRIHQPTGVKEIFITGGMAQVDGEKCIILAEQVYDLETMKIVEAEEMLQQANTHLATCKPDSVEMVAAAKHVTACETLIEIVSR